MKFTEIYFWAPLSRRGTNLYIKISIYNLIVLAWLKMCVTNLCDQLYNPGVDEVSAFYRCGNFFPFWDHRFDIKNFCKLKLLIQKKTTLCQSVLAAI